MQIILPNSVDTFAAYPRAPGPFLKVTTCDLEKTQACSLSHSGTPETFIFRWQPRWQFENPATPAKGTTCFRSFSIGNDLFTTLFTAQMGRGKIHWEAFSIRGGNIRCVCFFVLCNRHRLGWIGRDLHMKKNLENGGKKKNRISNRREKKVRKAG